MEMSKDISICLDRLKEKIEEICGESRGIGTSGKVERKRAPRRATPRPFVTHGLLN